MAKALLKSHGKVENSCRMLDTLLMSENLVVGNEIAVKGLNGASWRT